MHLQDIVSRFEQLLKSAILVEDKDHAKKLRKEVDEIRKAIKNVREVTREDASLVLNLLETHQGLYREITPDNPLYLSFFSILDTYQQLLDLMRKNSEVFMDVDASRVREMLGFPPPNENEAIRFKVELLGRPVHVERLLSFDINRTQVKIKLPRLEFQGLAKIDADLLYLDWIREKKSSDQLYSLGPINNPRIFPLSMMGNINMPRTIPLSMISNITIPSEDHGYDFDLLITSPHIENTPEVVRKFRKEYWGYDYHPIEEFLIRVKIHAFKGESSEDVQRKKSQIIELIKKACFSEIGWTVSHTRFLGPTFTPIMRGVLLPLGVTSPPPLNLDSTPLTASKYRELLTDKYDEDNVKVREDVIGNLPVLWGGCVVTSEFTTLTGVPVPLVPTKRIVASYCIAFLGFIEHVTLEVIQRFSKDSVKFAKDKQSGFVVSIPVLMTNRIDANGKKWVQETVDKPSNAMVVPAIVNLEENELYYCEQAPITLRYEYNNARLFIERYLITNEMRWKEPESFLEEPIETDCPYCGTKYRFDRIISKVKCRNCRNIFEVKQSSSS